MTPIGGYFELELPQGKEFHSTAIALNTGRNCLEYILRVRGYHRVYLPYYSCDVLLEPIKKLDIDHEFYHVDINLEIDVPIELKEGEAILYINYYGLKQDYVRVLAEQYGNKLIVDNTQAFYSMPLHGIDTFYSCRKFFGVSDGAYLYCDKPLDMELEQDESWERMDYLLKRIDISPEAAYDAFQRQEDQLRDRPIMKMSQLTHRIMTSIDYNGVAERRRENYSLLETELKGVNGICLPLEYDAVPMVYPFLTSDLGLRQRLVVNKIYVATYWPSVKCSKDSKSFDVVLSNTMLPLPIDQRYGSQDLNIILNFIINS